MSHSTFNLETDTYSNDTVEKEDFTDVDLKEEYSGITAVVEDDDLDEDDDDLEDDDLDIDIDEMDVDEGDEDAGVDEVVPTDADIDEDLALDEDNDDDDEDDF